MGRRLWPWLVVVLAGCSFRPQGLPDDPDGGPPADGEEPDARSDGLPPLDGREPDGPTALCPANYAPLGTSPSYYRVVNTNASWEDAADDCDNDDDGAPFVYSTHLVVVGNELERLAITSGNPAPVPGNSWVGLTDDPEEGATEGMFRWVTNEPTAGYPWVGQEPPWDGGDPDGADNENCVRFKNSYAFEDKPCDDSLRYVCECDPFPPR